MTFGFFKGFQDLGKSGWGRDDGCNRDDDPGHGHGGGNGDGGSGGGSGAGGGQGFPAIAADTGASGTPTFADSHATASDDLAAEDPGANTAQDDDQDDTDLC